MSDNAQKLGSLIYGDILPERDAVHIAIIPGECYGYLHRADFVKYNAGTGKFDSCREYVADGIVDPFLPNDKVKPGTKFWVCLKPGSILSLRHSWVHKTIPAESSVTDKKKFSQSWLEGFAETADMTYNDLIRAAEAYLKHGDYVCEGGRYEGFDLPDVFWDHYEIVTETKVPENERGHFFSCSC